METSQLENVNLKPCPFCGHDDYLIEQHLEGTVLHPAYRIYCDYCGASTGYTDKDHIDTWNNRTN